MGAISRRARDTVLLNRMTCSAALWELLTPSAVSTRQGMLADDLDLQLVLKPSSIALERALYYSNSDP